MKKEKTLLKKSMLATFLTLFVSGILKFIKFTTRPKYFTMEVKPRKDRY